MLSCKYYDEDYFDGGKGYVKYSFSGQYERWADELIRLFNPTTVLDIGCAKGFLVKALRDRGVKAWGCDISEYAIGHALPEVADYVYQYDITSGQPIELPQVELVVSYDTFEHIPKDNLPIVKQFMEAHGQQYYVRVATLNTPNWEHDASHITMHRIEWWQKFWPECVWEDSL